MAVDSPLVLRKGVGGRPSRRIGPRDASKGERKPIDPTPPRVPMPTLCGSVLRSTLRDPQNCGISYMLRLYLLESLRAKRNAKESIVSAQVTRE
jgi:hypothetical protein